MSVNRAKKSTFNLEVLPANTGFCNPSPSPKFQSH